MAIPNEEKETGHTRGSLYETTRMVLLAGMGAFHWRRMKSTTFSTAWWSAAKWQRQMRASWCVK